MAQRPPELYGIPIKVLARTCAVSERTARRWKDGTRCPPETALMILRRDLGVFSENWKGWTVVGDTLVSPHGTIVDRGDALTVQIMHGQIAALRHQIRELEDSRDGALENQPEPGDLPDISGGYAISA